jgi:hypothetical protein
VTGSGRGAREASACEELNLGDGRAGDSPLRRVHGDGRLTGEVHRGEVGGAA